MDDKMGALAEAIDHQHAKIEKCLGNTLAHRKWGYTVTTALDYYRELVGMLYAYGILHGSTSVNPTYSAGKAAEALGFDLFALRDRIEAARPKNRRKK